MREATMVLKLIMDLDHCSSPYCDRTVQVSACYKLSPVYYRQRWQSYYRLLQLPTNQANRATDGSGTEAAAVFAYEVHSRLADFTFIHVWTSTFLLDLYIWFSNHININIVTSYISRLCCHPYLLVYSDTTMIQHIVRIFHGH